VKARIAAVLVVLAVLSGPASALALADQFPFCPGADAPTIGQPFQELAARVGDRVGHAVECEHAEPATGDLQQQTSAGLLYLRQTTSTPTFTDGAEHWALRGAQSFHWTTDSPDPPADAEAFVAAQLVPQPTVAAAAAAAPQPVATIANPATSSTGTSLPVAVTVLVIGLLLCVGFAVLLQRQRARSAAPRGAAGPGQLVAAAVGPTAGLATPLGQPPRIPAVSVRELQGALQDIGRNRVTEQADAVLQFDPEAMIWQGHPSVAAVLAPKLVRWLLVVILSLFAGAWLASLIAGSSSSPSAPDSAATVQWLVVLAAIAWVVWSAGVSYARLRATKYRATRQRIDLTSGVFGQTTITRELHELGDAIINRPLHYRLFGVGNLAIAHRTKPPIRLEAIDNPEGVRDMLRAAGQIEAARIQKAAWR
jgi:hypothetical protein